MEAVDVSLAVGRHQDWSNRRDAGGIERSNLLPDSFLARGQFQSINLGGHFARAAKVNGTGVLTPIDRYVAGFHAAHGSRLTSGGRVEVAFLVGTNSNNHLAVGRNRKVLCIDAFGRDGLRFSSRNILHIKAHAAPWFVARKNEALAVRKPPRPLMVNRIGGQRLSFTCAGGQQPELSGR